MVTHEPDVAQYTKRIIEMKDGRILRESRLSVPRDADEELRKLPAEEE